MKRSYNLTLKDIPKSAKDIANKLKGGEVIALIGDLGSGKTTFVKALAKALKIKDKVTSPTFVLMNAFSAHLPENKKPILFLHLDLYRTKNFKEIKDLGIEELWQKKHVVTAIEWADKIKTHLPKNVWILKFFHDK